MNMEEKDERMPSAGSDAMPETTGATDSAEVSESAKLSETPDRPTELPESPEYSEVSESPAIAKPQEPQKNGFASLFDYLEILVFSLCAVFLIFTFGVRLCSVSGPSMETTLSDSDKLLISDTFYTPERGDIIVFHQTISDEKSPYYHQFNETIIKRVIGVGGDHVKINFTTAEIFVNGEKIDEPYLPDSFSYRYYSGIAEYDVPEGQLFVLGDNRNNSTDSRSGIIGFVDERQVLGRVLCRVFPMSGFGAVN